MMRAETNNVMDFHDADRYSSVAALELIKAKCVIEQFIYSCSHSLRAPLKSIAGLVYLLKSSDDSKNEEQQYFFRAIEKTTGKMETLLDELEQFLSNSRQKIATEPIKIESVINRCLDEVHESICERKLNVIVSVRQPGLFYTDENRVTMVLSQLISNAIQFSDASKSNRRLLIRVKVSQESCQLRMVDNGVGISAQVLPKIFDLFFRGSVQSAGAGVGLYIVQDALTALGGTVTVRSNEGKGAFFQVTIPNLPL